MNTLNKILVKLFDLHFHEWKTFFSKYKRKCEVCKKTQVRHPWDMNNWLDVTPRITDPRHNDPIDWEAEND